MALVVQQPVKPDDFVLMTHTKTKLEAVLDGTVKFPGNGVCSLLLHGTYGTGKTTMANLLPGWIETCKKTSFLVSNPAGQVVDQLEPYHSFFGCAHGQNSVTMFNSIQTATSLISFNSSGLHFVILDEVDHLTPAASASLKAIMNRRDVVFILTTNHLNKVDQGVMNRSILLDMNAAPPNAWLSKLKEICAASNVNPPTDEALTGIILAGQGSARSILTDMEITNTKRSSNKHNEIESK